MLQLREERQGAIRFALGEVDERRGAERRDDLPVLAALPRAGHGGLGRVAGLLKVTALDE